MIAIFAISVIFPEDWVGDWWCYLAGPERLTNPDMRLCQLSEKTSWTVTLWIMK